MLSAYDEIQRLPYSLMNNLENLKLEKDPHPILHPLQPLSAFEMSRCLSYAHECYPNMQFLTVCLAEPSKSFVLRWKIGEFIPRSAMLDMHDSQLGKTYKIFFNLITNNIETCEHLPGILPRFMNHEYDKAQELLQKSPEFLMGLEKRGIDPDKIRCDLWSVGWFGKEDNPDRRLAWALCYYKKDDNCEEYIYPIEGLTPFIDLDKMEIVRIDDFRIAEMPVNDCGYFGRSYSDDHQSNPISLLPLKVVQPQGVDFKLDGHILKWQQWEMVLGFTPREGLLIHQVTFCDPNGERRPILYRASISEMVVPYGANHQPHSRKNAFDLSEDGIGNNLNPLNPGCDCIGNPAFLDAVTHDPFGNVVIIPNAICIHEEDSGVLWKHSSWRSQESWIRRSRRLVVSCFTTIGNYDYGFYWYFGLDGTIEFDNLLTGILSVSTLTPGLEENGTLLSRNPSVVALYHQHFLCLRLDMQLDGFENSVVETNSYPISAQPQDEVNGKVGGCGNNVEKSGEIGTILEKAGEIGRKLEKTGETGETGKINQHEQIGLDDYIIELDRSMLSSAFITKETVFERELEAQRNVNLETARSWKIINPNRINPMTGFPVGYRIDAGEVTFPMARSNSSILKRSPFIGKHLWVTQYNQNELFPAGEYPAQQPFEKDGISTWTRQNRSIKNKDIVLWYNVGVHHVPRPEEWPIMSAHHCGFSLKPSGFFEKSPSLFVPPPPCSNK